MKHDPGRPFKLYRRQQNMVISESRRRSFGKEFPEHSIRPFEHFSLDLLTTHEMWQSLERSMVHISSLSVLRHIARHRPASSLKSVAVRPNRLVFGEPAREGLRPIKLTLDDTQGVLEEERQAFLRNVAAVTGMALKNSVFVPHLRVGTAPAEPDINSLHRLAEHIPQSIHLSAVRVFPRHDEIWRFRHQSQ